MHGETVKSVVDLLRTKP